jgi:hypothetical protein
MAATTTTLAFVLGAALLAMWLETRFGAAPAALPTVLLHVGLGMAVVGAMPPAMQLVLGTAPTPTITTAVLLGVFLPCMTYAQLTGLWLLKALQERLLLR